MMPVETAPLLFLSLSMCIHFMISSLNKKLVHVFQTIGMFLTILESFHVSFDTKLM